MTGTIVRFDESRGYGFITPDEGHEDVFMHANDLLADEYLYQAGRRVEFFIGASERGPKASEIRLVTEGAVDAPLPTVRANTESAPLPAVVVSAAPKGEQGEEEEPTCDVLSLSEFRSEVTEILIRADETLTAGQIHRVRTGLAEAALAHGWVEATEG